MTMNEKQMDATRYVIGVRDLDGHPEFEISESDYRDIRQARNVVLAALGVEETYELLVTNFLDFERELLDITVEHSVRSNFLLFDDFFHVRHRASRRIVNLLTSARLFIDQLPQRIGHCCPDVLEPGKLAKAMLSAEYDDRFGYRFMEAMRNYVQHTGLPVGSMRLGGGRNEPEGVLGYTLEVYANKQLLAGTSFKATVFNEMPDIVDLKRAIRDYMTGISAVHRNMRELMKEGVEEACSRLTRAFDAYLGGSPSKVGLSAMKLDGQIEAEYVPIIVEWERTWRSLVTGNQSVVALNKKFVTSELQPKAMGDGPDTTRVASR